MDEARERTDVSAEMAIDHMIGRRVAGMRKLRGISRRQLARDIGITAQQLAKCEAGSNRIAASRLVTIALALDCSLSQIMGVPLDGSVSHLDVGVSSDPETTRLLRIWERLDDRTRIRVLALIESIDDLQRQK